MKQALIASALMGALLSAGTASAAEGSQPVAQPPQAVSVAPVYEVPGRVNRAGSIYFGQ